MAASLDTLKAAKRLRDAGVPEAHAEAVVETLREAQEAGAAQLATRADLAQVRSELKADLAEFRAEVRGELTLVKWMLGFSLALGVAILLRLLVP